MTRPNSISQISIGGLAVAIIALGVCLLYVLPAILSDNILFATSAITVKPIQAIVYYEGKTTIYEPSQPGYDTLIDGAYKTLSLENGFEEMGWSDARFQQARSEGIAVELIYTEPVKLPGNRMNIADVYRVFFPLKVFGFEGNYVFRGGLNDYWGAPTRVDNMDAVNEAVNTVINTKAEVNH
jgi:hypothetical protein